LTGRNLGQNLTLDAARVARSGPIRIMY